MSQSQQRTHKWRPPVKVLVVDYIKKHKRVKRSDLYLAVGDHAERTVRHAIRDLVKKGIVTEDPCECGFTAFVELA